MKKWVCAKCNLYVRVKPKKISEGDKVYYYGQYLRRKTRKIIKVGVVLKRVGSFLYLKDNGVEIELKDIEVYPVDAPAYFIYNMFGCCTC